MGSLRILCCIRVTFIVLQAAMHAMYSSIFDSHSPPLKQTPELIRGYVVAAIEHSDGSACIARCLNADGSLGWVRSLDPVAYAAGTEMKSFEERRGQNEIRQAIAVNVY